MKRLLEKVGAGLVMCAVMVSGVQAATITPSATQITLEGDQDTFTIDLLLEENEPFSAAEFGIDLPEGVELAGEPEYLDEALQSVNQTPIVTRENRTYFGFFSGSNEFQGSYTIRLTFTYSGEEDAQISLGHSKIVTLLGDGKTESDTSSAPFTVLITRTEDSGGSGGTGGSGGSGGGTSGGTEIDDEDVPLAPGVFEDLEGHWAKDNAEHAVELGLFAGTSETTFSPDLVMTRAMMATVLWATEGSPVADYRMDYDDVSAGDWYAEAVRWATSEGVVSGVGGGRFDPNSPITREQMAVMLYAYTIYKGYDIDQDGKAAQEFNDYSDISDWAVAAMEWAVNAGMIGGKPGNILDPGGYATRAEVATILRNYHRTFVK
mgnify:CR=1 FL=1